MIRISGRRPSSALPCLPRLRQAVALAPFAFAALVALAACGDFPTRPPLGMLDGAGGDVTPVSDHRLNAAFDSPRKRVELGERVAALAEARFYDPQLNGVDWAAVRAKYRPRLAAARSDQAVYVELKEMIAELKDSHSVVWTPRETVDARRFATPRIGVVLGAVDGEIALLAVEPGGPGERAGLRRGDVLTAIGAQRLDEGLFAQPVSRSDGDALFYRALPADPIDARRVQQLRAALRLLRRPPDAPPAPFDLTLRRDGSPEPIAVSVRPQSREQAPEVELRWYDGQVALIRFDRFQSLISTRLAAALDTAADARAIIIDLRGNAGGSVDLYRWFSGRFVDQERVALRLFERARPGAREQRTTDLKIGPVSAAAATVPGVTLSTQPLAVLIDGRTASAAELTALTLAEQRGAVLIGEPSCGCAVSVREEYVLPDGGGVRIAETGFVSARGVRIEGAPLVPSVRVVPTLADLRAGRDPVLDEALRRVGTRAGR